MGKGKGDLMRDLVALIVVVAEMGSTMRREETGNARVEPTSDEVGLGVEVRSNVREQDVETGVLNQMKLHRLLRKLENKMRKS